jgi:hypothetical protein
MMVWQVLLVKRLHDTSLILVGKMWAGLVDLARAHPLNGEPPQASPEDMTIPFCVDRSDEAIALIREHHTKWLGA